ncbi:MAG TPA: cytochrome C oxidase subunit IV family protein [bacterium]
MRESASPVRTYVVVWGWLAGLMLLGVLLAELPMPKRTIVLIVLALSSAKALLVALYYMHLKVDRRLLGLIAIAPLGLIALAIGVIFSSHLVKF